MHSTRSFLIVCALCASCLAGTEVFAQQNVPSSTSMSATADHSGMNTPVNQPNDKADIKLAAAVRRAIVKDKALSVIAHNVKLVAAQGVVTLRGPVDNADEKTRVEADVKAVPGVSRVDNQLDTKN